LQPPVQPGWGDILSGVLVDIGKSGHIRPIGRTLQQGVDSPGADTGAYQTPGGSLGYPEGPGTWRVDVLSKPLLVVFPRGQVAHRQEAVHGVSGATEVLHTIRVAGFHHEMDDVRGELLHDLVLIADAVSDAGALDSGYKESRTRGSHFDENRKRVGIADDEVF